MRTEKIPPHTMAKARHFKAQESAGMK